MSYKMTACVYIPKRGILVVLGHIGFFMLYALRVNLSVAMVAMVNSTYSNVDISVESECDGNSTDIRQFNKSTNGEFNWNQKDQGILLSSFYYGYLVTQLPGGWLAVKFGGKYVFGLGILATSVLTLLSPIAARTNMYLLVAIRILEGLAGGVVVPSFHAIAAQWAPPIERTRMIMFAHAGEQLGTIIALPVCGVLSDSNILGGWPSAFYIFGVIGVIWFAVWVKFISNSPEDHPTISSGEEAYIIDALEECSSNTRNASVPWLQIFISIRVWAIIVAHFTFSWVWNLILTGLPLYFQQVLNFNLNENGLLSTLPFIAGLIIDFVGSVMADYSIKSKFSVTQTRRLLGIIGFYPAAIFLVVASFANCDQVGLSVACMVFGLGFLCFNSSGFNCNHLDIAPRFGGILMGITNTAGSIAGSVAPIVTGHFTNNEPTRANYRTVFLVAAGISVVGGTFFNCIVSGKQQKWNDLDEDPEMFGNNDIQVELEMI